jgi:iturin family lipopeptide synthetase A
MTGQKVSLKHEKETFLDAFKIQVRKTPNAIAVKCENKTLTYQELEEKSNQLSNYLSLNFDINRDDLVLIYMERSELFNVAILGIWKAGAAYVPLDPDYPLNRIKCIVKDTKTKVVITTDSFISKDVESYLLKTKVGIVSEISYSKFPNIAPITSLKPEDLSYVIFTSGSTGKPKGVMIEHRGMLNHLYSKIEMLNLNENSIIAQNAPQSFDISVWQFVTILMVGGTVVIYPKSLLFNPLSFALEVKKDKVDVLELVPVYLSFLLDNEENFSSAEGLFKDLKYLLATGEILISKLCNRWLSHYPNIPMINAYGPTEAADDITCYEINKPHKGSIPIGIPIRNMQIYIVNDEGKQCEIGEKGELCVSGVGVGRGYLNEPEKTKKVFTDDPFQVGRRMYKTGDIARYRQDGIIEFFGRKDNQIKLRGYRIELGEIEEQLSKFHLIDNAVVVVKSLKSSPYLVGFFSTIHNATIDKQEIVKFLSLTLPDYMIPRHFVKIDKLPVTVNGKIDRKSLAKEEM